MYYLISILFGLIPEVLYFTLFITYTKNIKEKRIKLFLLISIAYFLCMLIQQYKTIYYILLVALSYVILKFLYKDKTQIIDIFVFSISASYLTILSYVCFLFLKEDLSNYYFLYCCQRILLFLPMLFRHKFNLLYKIYCHLWNRKDKEKRPIKSITLRNISLIIINIAIFITNIIAISIINFLK